jgi:hypothetical protein
MSEYDRFLTWVRQKRRCTDDELETNINSIPIQYVRSIMKGIDEAAGRPRVPKKTEIDIAKAFLLKCYSMAPISPDILDESSSYNFTGMSGEDIKKMLTKSIKLNLNQIKASNLLASKHVMLIARSLTKLLETFGAAQNGLFLDYIKDRLDISKTSYYYYMDYYSTMSKYPRFQTLPIAFRSFRSMTPKRIIVHLDL